MKTGFNRSPKMDGAPLASDDPAKSAGRSKVIRACEFCGEEFSYSNFASHKKRCKVRLSTAISATNDEITRLRNSNAELLRRCSEWEMRYREVKAINEKLIDKFPRQSEVVKLD